MENTQQSVVKRLSLSALFLGSQCVSSITAFLGTRSRRTGIDMSYFGTPLHQNSMQLQSTISAATSGVGDSIIPHHPITCVGGDLYYDEDGTFSCAHAAVPGDDARTQSSLNHSMVLLLLEPAIINQEWRYKTPDQLEYEWNEKHPEEPWK